LLMSLSPIILGNSGSSLARPIRCRHGWRFDLQCFAEVFQPGAAVLEQTAPNAEPCDVILPAVDPTVRKIQTVDLVLSDSIEIVGDGPEDQ
jgi:hypothetical protein